MTKRSRNRSVHKAKTTEAIDTGNDFSDAIPHTKHENHFLGENDNKHQQKEKVPFSSRIFTLFVKKYLQPVLKSLQVGTKSETELKIKDVKESKAFMITVSDLESL